MSNPSRASEGDWYMGTGSFSSTHVWPIQDSVEKIRMSPWWHTQESVKYLTAIEPTHHFSQQNHNILIPPTSLMTQIYIKVPLKCQVGAHLMALSWGYHRRPFCLELVREVVPHGGRGAEIHRGHEEPGHAANSAYLSLTRNVYRCSMRDWLKVKLICLVQLPEGSRWLAPFVICLPQPQTAIWFVGHDRHPHP